MLYCRMRLVILLTYRDANGIGFTSVDRKASNYRFPFLDLRVCGESERKFELGASIQHITTFSEINVQSHWIISFGEKFNKHAGMKVHLWRSTGQLCVTQDWTTHRLIAAVLKHHHYQNLRSRFGIERHAYTKSRLDPNPCVCVYVCMYVCMCVWLLIPNHWTELNYNWQFELLMSLIRTRQS